MNEAPNPTTPDYILGSLTMKTPAAGFRYEPIRDGQSLREVFGAHEKNLRSNRENDGRPFQRELEITAGGYQCRRIATLRKVDPPTRLVGSGAARRVLFMANPFLDFVGVWTAHHGRALFIEAKSTATHRLPFNRSGGITPEQLASIKTWRHAGAAAAVLWRFGMRVALFLPEDLIQAEGRGDKSLVFENGRRVPAGEGNLIWDFLPVLESAIWPQAKSAPSEPVA